MLLGLIYMFSLSNLLLFSHCFSLNFTNPVNVGSRVISKKVYIFSYLKTYYK